MPPLSLCYALADQSFARTKSLGILHLSVQLAVQLSRALRPDERLRVLANSTLREGLRLSPPATCELHERPATSKLGRMWWDQSGVFNAATKSGCEWLFLPKGFSSFLRRPPVRLAAYVHDIMHEIYRERWPGVFPRVEGAYFDRSLMATLSHAEVIFTNTDFTRQELLRLAYARGLTPPRIVTAGIGFEIQGAPIVAEQRKGVLALVSPWPHKRSDLALEYLRAWKERSGFRETIHVVGGLPHGLSIPDGPGWEWHTRLGHEPFQRLLGNSRAIVYFSEYEGFGMPPVEAVLAGAVPVVSALPATRETLGTCGCFFENSSLHSFEGAMKAALETPPETMEAWMRYLRAEHCWSRVTSRILTELRR